MLPSEILNIITDSGGYTANGGECTGRYIVGIEDLGIIPLSDTEALIAKITELSNKKFIWGAWVNKELKSDIVYFDHVVMTDSLYTAISLGKKFSQIAIFDNIKGVEIMLDTVA